MNPTQAPVVAVMSLVIAVLTWAGHSVYVLLRIYAKCVVGQDEAARRRIEQALS